jgi:hypothetical protein
LKKGERIENLGTEMIGGVETVGQRETTTLEPGTIGNDAQLYITKEFWYSPQLGINLRVKRSDPRYGTQIFEVSDISRSEPDPKFFSVPAGFSVTDRRTPKRAAKTQ